MKVLCVSNQYLILPEYLRLRYSRNGRYTVSQSITLTKTYIVYAVLTLNGYSGYYICDDDAESYPLWYPLDFFNIIDSRLSRYWVASVHKDNKTDTCLFFGFPEWANGGYFHEDLIEGKEREMDLFKKYKQLMDLEFPDPAITEVAQIGDENWLICPSCIDGWENSNVRDALVICPKCCETFCNPRYKDVFPGII